MRSTLTAFAALAALALPAGAPSLAMAQELTLDAGSVPRIRDEPEAGTEIRQARVERARAPAENLQERRGGGERNRGGDGGAGRQDRGGRGEGRGDQGGEARAPRSESRDRSAARPERGERRDRSEVRPDRGDRQGGRPGRDFTPPNASTAPAVEAPDRSQDRRRGPDRRDDTRRDGGGRDWNRDDGQERGQNRGQDRDRDRDQRDLNRDRNGGGWTGGNGGNWNGGGQDRGGWDRNRNDGERNWSNDRNGRRDYNGFRNRWNQDSWRRDWSRSRGYDWWRNDRGFRGYSGFRAGFYFAPNYGYYSVPRNYWGQRWYAGDYLPSIFWRYRLDDWRTFGLGFPPPGTQWVAVDNHIYLIDAYDGYIIEVIFDAWRW